MLLPARAVKAFVSGNKSDAIDARAIWAAVRHGSTKAVAVKTEAQQAVLALHRMRQQLVKMRTMQINELRGLLTEYGEVFAKGRAGLIAGLAGALERLESKLPTVVVEALREQWLRVGKLDAEVARIEASLRDLLKNDRDAQRILAIRRVGLLTATAATAAMGRAEALKSGREFAAWLGLAPAHTGTGGKVRMLGMSKRGDTYLRTLLIHGARNVVMRNKSANSWLQQIRLRRPLNVVVVAVANKMARTFWAMVKHQRDFRSDWVPQCAA